VASSSTTIGAQSEWHVLRLGRCVGSVVPTLHHHRAAICCPSTWTYAEHDWNARHTNALA